MFWNEWPTLKECVEQKLLLEVDLYFARCVLYRNNLKNREFDKEAPQNSCSERATIAERQGASENKNSEVKPTRSKPDSSSCFGIETWEVFMLMWAVIFLIVAIIAALLGFRGVANTATQIAKILFFIFIILFLVSLIYALFFHTPATIVVQ
jgi:uncharacterized membrane protein YtjA (UPF0391 family)